MTDDKKQGWFRGAVDKIGAQVENQKTQQAVTEAQAGNLAIEKQFGTSRIAIYDGGFVRVSRLLNTMTPLTPYEKLRSIKYRDQVQDRSAFGAAWNGPFASKPRRTLSLTIATDRKVHTLTTEGQMLSGDGKAGMALSGAGQAASLTPRPCRCRPRLLRRRLHRSRLLRLTSPTRSRSWPTCTPQASSPTKSSLRRKPTS